MEICSHNSCTGCKACLNACPKSAISFHEDEKGFWYPQISNECVECGICKKVCPVSLELTSRNMVGTVYAAFTKDKEIRAGSSSGGLFTEFAKFTLAEKGVVFATRLSDDIKRAYFTRCDSIDELGALRGSKYVQSDPQDVYVSIKKELQAGRKVLFVGVPCQVAALKSFLRQNYTNLFTIDIICHGVPSAKLWKEYVEWCEKNNNSRVVNASFRYKKPSWMRFSMKLDYMNGKSTITSKFDDPYLIAFLKEISMRESCYNCQYASSNRVGDITLADFWGYKSTDFKMRNTEKGISLVIVNNARGQEEFNRIKDDLMYQERTFDEAVSGNRSLKEPWKKNPVSEEFWADYCNGESLDTLFARYCKPYRFPIKTRINWIMLNHMYLIPKWILRVRHKSKY